MKIIEKIFDGLFSWTMAYFLLIVSLFFYFFEIKYGGQILGASLGIFAYRSFSTLENLDKLYTIIKNAKEQENKNKAF
jgi:hypothetical protein